MPKPRRSLPPPPPGNKYIQFRPSSIHGLGAFAIRKIRKGTRIIEYVGRKISKQESLQQLQQQNTYIFDLDDQWDLDGNVEWNPARFINHSCQPNCEAINEDGRIWIVALRTIQPGEEITFNYGYDLTDYRDHPCHCGAPNCVGYMVAEEFFEEVRRKEARRPRRRSQPPHRQ